MCALYYESLQPDDPNYGLAQYAKSHGLTQLDFDEWSYVCEVLGKNIPFEDLHLMNQYIDLYNFLLHKDYDWDWCSYRNDAESQDLFYDLISLGHAAESGNILLECVRLYVKEGIFHVLEDPVISNCFLLADLQLVDDAARKVVSMFNRALYGESS